MENYTELGITILSIVFLVTLVYLMRKKLIIILELILTAIIASMLTLYVMQHKNNNTNTTSTSTSTNNINNITTECSSDNHIKYIKI